MCSGALQSAIFAAAFAVGVQAIPPVYSSSSDLRFHNPFEYWRDRLVLNPPPVELYLQSINKADEWKSISLTNCGANHTVCISDEDSTISGKLTLDRFFADNTGPVYTFKVASKHQPVLPNLIVSSDNARGYVSTYAELKLGGPLLEKVPNMQSNTSTLHNQPDIFRYHSSNQSVSIVLTTASGEERVIDHVCTGMPRSDLPEHLLFPAVQDRPCTPKWGYVICKDVYAIRTTRPPNGVTKWAVDQDAQMDYWD